jgi:hypothetical protein
MEVKKVERVHNSIAMASPLESGLTLTLYDDNVTMGQHMWVVDYDLVRDYMYVRSHNVFTMISYFNFSSGLPLALLDWPKTKDSKPSVQDFGLNPDYVLNHPKDIYQENAPNHPNRRLFDNTDAVIYPQRSRTPPPLHNIWHETSFIESHWQVLLGIIIRYYERGTLNERNSKLYAKDNNSGFFMKHLRSGEKTLETRWKWAEISYMKLTPVRASYRNRDYLWIIIDGEHVGRYCKAVYAPLEPKDGESLALFTVAFAHVVSDEQGNKITIVDTPQEEREIREDLVGVVYLTKKQRESEPNVYLGASGIRKREKERKEAAKRGTATDLA